jgi:transposase
LTDYLSVEKVLRESRNKEEFERILCVWLKIALALNSRQVAMAIGWTAASVRRMQARFAKDGIQCFACKAPGGRKRENISISREKQILEKFVRQTRGGSALNVQEIKRAYELSAGKSVPRSTIYRLIDRHGLRRFLPRARRTAKDKTHIARI